MGDATLYFGWSRFVVVPQSLIVVPRYSIVMNVYRRFGNPKECECMFGDLSAHGVIGCMVIVTISLRGAITSRLVSCLHLIISATATKCCDCTIAIQIPFDMACKYHRRE